MIGSLGELDDLRSRPGQPVWNLPPCEACSDRSQRGESPCPLHICEQCNGKGAVCPGCRGMRFIRVPHAVGNNVERCTRCCEGNQVNDVLEMRTILAYIARSQPTQPTVTPDHEVM